MLTATYSYAVISAELKQGRRTLSALEQDVRACLRTADKPDGLQDLARAFDSLSAFHASLADRKIQTYIVPAIQAVSGEADNLFAEFAFLNSQAGNALQAAHDILRNALLFPATPLKAVELSSLVDHYFRYLRRRLTKEEELLLPAAWRVLPADTWFGIAKQCMSEGRNQKAQADSGMKRALPAAPSSKALHESLSPA